MVYKNKALFYKTVSLPENHSEQEIQLTIQFDWLVCEVSCIPCSKTFTIDLPVTNRAPKRNDHFDYFQFPSLESDFTGDIQHNTK